MLLSLQKQYQHIYYIKIKNMNYAYNYCLIQRTMFSRMILSSISIPAQYLLKVNKIYILNATLHMTTSYLWASYKSGIIFLRNFLDWKKLNFALKMHIYDVFYTLT